MKDSFLPFYKAEAEHTKEKFLVEQIESQVVEAETKMKQLTLVSKELDELENSYWQIFNDYSLKIQDHLNEKAAIVNKIHLATEKLAELRRTNVCLDVFKIDHDGPFGTISGFR